MPKTKLLSVAAFLLLALSSVLSAQAPSGNASVAVPQITLFGNIVAINGNQITLAATFNPAVQRTFTIDPGTLISQRKTKLNATALRIGLTIVVTQVRAGRDYRTDRINILAASR